MGPNNMKPHYVQHKIDIISENTSNHSHELQNMEALNIKFNTNIFTQNSPYIVELGFIYAAKAQIDSALSEIMPTLLLQIKIATSVKKFMEAVDDLRVATKKCVTEMEEQRKQMYQVAKNMVKLRDGLVKQPSQPSLRNSMYNKQQTPKLDKKTSYSASN
jgi:hypothetical protein